MDNYKRRFNDMLDKNVMPKTMGITDDLGVFERGITTKKEADHCYDNHSWLHLLVRKRWVEGIKHLIKLDANVNALDMNEETPLQVLLWGNSDDDPRIFEICKLLVDAGTDISEQRKDRCGDSYYVLAFKNNHSKEVQEYLLVHQNKKVTKKR